jgi:purine-binding chemotaxis protein CheW
MSLANDSEQVVVFSLSGEEYALPISKVHEIIRFTQPRSVSASEPWIRGVIPLRGKIVRVYDLATRMGLGGERSADAKIVIVESGDDVTGVIVDAVEEVLTIEANQVEPSPVGDSDTFESIARVDDRLIVLLNPEGLFGVRGAAAAPAEVAVPAPAAAVTA